MMVNSPYQSILQHLQANVPVLTPDNTASAATQGIAQCQLAIAQMLSHWRSHGFVHHQEELYFLRDSFPASLALWRYLQWVLAIERGRPLAPAPRQAAYYTTHLRLVEKELLADAGQVQWLQTLDEEQASRYFQVWPTIPATTFPILLAEPAPHNPYSYQLANYQAAEKAAAYLIARISQGLLPQAGSQVQVLQWTQTKVALAELIYALQEYGVFGTKLEVSGVATYIGLVFGVSMENIYKMYENMRIRKKNRTPFLDGLRAALERRMDHDDLHAL